MQLYNRSTSLLALALAASLAAGAPVLAQNPAPAQSAQTADPVVAKIDGTEIRQSDLNAAEEDIGAATARMGEAQKREYLVGYVTDLFLAAKAAEAKKLHEADAFKRKFDYARRKLLAETILSAETKIRVTEAEARKIYDEELKKLTPEEEVSARHILVESEDEAKTLYEKIKAGADFAALAKEHSKDPGSKNDGGSLGFFVKSQMVTEFADAAFALKPGDVSAPVKSQFGWHIIKTEERRLKKPPSFEEVRAQIEEYLARKAQSDLIAGLRKDAKIERIGEAPAAPAPAAAPAEQPKKQ